MKRRKIDPETKMATVLEGLKDERSGAEICRKYLWHHLDQPGYGMALPAISPQIQ